MGQQRPIGVSILVIVFFFLGVMSFFSGISMLFLNILPGSLGLIAWIPIALSIGGVVFGALYFAFGWGMWIGAGWARVGAIVLAALNLVLYLFSAVVLIVGMNIFGVPLSFPGVGIGCLVFAVLWGGVIYYLLRSEVEAFFTGGSSGSMEYVQSTVAQVNIHQSYNSIPPAAPSVPTPIQPVEQPRMPPTEVTSQPLPASAWLVARTGSRTNKDFGLQRNENLIGRDGSQADIVLDDGTVSKQHAKIKYESGQFVVYDLGSTNGTFVNNRRVQRQALLDDDAVRFGNVQFVFKEVRAKRTN